MAINGTNCNNINWGTIDGTSLKQSDFTINPIK